MRKASQIVVGVILLTLGGIFAAPAQPPRQSAGGTGVVRLAERGDAQAQTRLGFMFETGQGVPQNYTEAAYWYRRAAEQGDPNAQYLLGNSFNLGKGVPIDWVQAYIWFNLSASRTRPGDERKHRVTMRDIMASKLGRPLFEEAQNLAILWRPKPERRSPLK